MPLNKIKVLELAGLAPAPFCGMILADFGASVITVNKTGEFSQGALHNGKKSIALNLKSKKGADVFKRLSDQSDIIIDPFRKGVMERLGLGPDVLTKSNKMLIYARLTGFGQDGPYSKMAGHDINYVGLSGLLSLFGRENEKPTPPINFAADFAGGGLTCAMGIILALYEREKSKMGQIIDTSMVEGTAYVGSWLFRTQDHPLLWGRSRGKNVLDTGVHFYDTYETKDGKFMAVGALEPQFYNVLLEKLNLTNEELPQFENFEINREKLGIIFKQKKQDEWSKIFDGSDACVTPVLSIDQVKNHHHNKALDSFYHDDKSGNIIPKPSPRLSRTPGKSKAINFSSPAAGENTKEILSEYGFKPEEIEDYLSNGIVQQVNRKSKL